MKKNIRTIENYYFDRSKIKGKEKQIIAAKVYSMMLLTLSPNLLLYYLNAIRHMEYKQAHKLLNKVYLHFLCEDHCELGLLDDEHAEALFDSLVEDMERCMSRYNGGFIFGLQVELGIDQDSPMYRPFIEFVSKYLLRLEAFSANEWV